MYNSRSINSYFGDNNLKKLNFSPQFPFFNVVSLGVRLKIKITDEIFKGLLTGYLKDFSDHKTTIMKVILQSHRIFEEKSRRQELYKMFNRNSWDQEYLFLFGFFTYKFRFFRLNYTNYILSQVVVNISNVRFIDKSESNKMLQFKCKE